MYVLDTNVIATAWNIYPAEVFPSLWEELSRLCNTGVFVYPKEIYKEISTWYGPQAGWMSSHLTSDHILPKTEDTVTCYGKIFNWVAQEREPQYRPSALREFASVADSWALASAKEHNLPILTYEVPTDGGKKKVKIPDVADHFGIARPTFLEVLRHHKLHF